MDDRGLGGAVLEQVVHDDRNVAHVHPVGLVLTAAVQGRFEPGYLSVEWFDSGQPLASDSVYLDASQRAATFRLTAPDEGAYRAVLSFGGAVLRQVELYEVQP